MADIFIHYTCYYGASDADVTHSHLTAMLKKGHGEMAMDNILKIAPSCKRVIRLTNSGLVA